MMQYVLTWRNSNLQADGRAQLSVQDDTRQQDWFLFKFVSVLIPRVDALNRNEDLCNHTVLHKKERMNPLHPQRLNKEGQVI